MTTHEKIPVNQSVQPAEKYCLDMFSLGLGFQVTPDDYDVMQSLAEQGRVPEDWFRQNYENRERFLKEQRECGFIE